MLFLGSFHVHVQASEPASYRMGPDSGLPHRHIGPWQDDSITVGDVDMTRIDGEAARSEAGSSVAAQVTTQALT